MKNKLAKAFKKVLLKLNQFASKIRSSEASGESEGGKIRTGSLQSATFRIVGDKISRFLPLFEDLSLHLQRAGLKISFKVYISLAVFSSFLISLVTFMVIPCLLVFMFDVPFFPAFLFGLGGSLFAVAFSILGFYIYPVYRADKFKREIEDELAFTTGYMSILASAGVPPEKIFYSLSNLPIRLAVSAEAKNIIRDVNLFGLDIISALEQTSRRTPSERFREMIEGLISTIHSGSNLAAYLREKSKQHMRLKRISLRKFSDTLSMLSEFYVAILVTGPLLLIIMLAVMAMMGGGGLGLLSPDLLLNILTYIGIPVGSVMFLLILDAISPQW
ncbi:MAG: type II secretion system F family protein [Candidatus Bathyarchaeia archaeon]